jgi:hypothetical protein
VGFHQPFRRIYFHLEKGDDVIRDTIGVPVLDLEAALHAALTTIEEMRQQGSQTDVYTGWRLKVVNGSGDVLLSLCLDGTALH